jgi:hypothetical protein
VQAAAAELPLGELEYAVQGIHDASSVALCVVE